MRNLLVFLLLLGLPAGAVEYHLKPRETQKVGSTGLTVRVVERQPQGIKLQLGKERFDLKVGEEVRQAGYYLVKLERVGESIVTVSVVSRPSSADVDKFLQSWGWRIERELAPLELEIGSVTGMPTTFYQSASQSVALDLKPLEGKKVQVRTFRMQQRTGEGAEVRAYVAVQDGWVYGAWVATDAAVAPGVIPVSDTTTIQLW